MAFKMKGYQAHGKSPMQKNGLWSKIKSKASKAKEYIKDRTINMSNIGGLTGDDKKMWDAKNKAEQEAHNKRMAKAKKDREYQEAKGKEKESYKKEYKLPEYKDTWVAQKEKEYADKGGYAQYAKDQKRDRGSFAQEYNDRFPSKKSKLSDEYAEKKYQEAKAARNVKKEKDLASHSPKTEKESKNEGLLAQNIKGNKSSKNDKKDKA